MRPKRPISGSIWFIEGLDQVTWMDVCIDGVLPTPRHGKPVEINAYWYNALRILQELAPTAGETGVAYGALAVRVRQSFVQKFWMEDKGYLKDVLSGTTADFQLRCNQVWAVSLPFTMLSAQQERQVLETVSRYLYTPQGLRTLSPEDPEFHPFYGGNPGPSKGCFAQAWSVGELLRVYEQLERIEQEGFDHEIPGLHF